MTIWNLASQVFPDPYYLSLTIKKTANGCQYAGKVGPAKHGQRRWKPRRRQRGTRIVGDLPDAERFGDFSRRQYISKA